MINKLGRGAGALVDQALFAGANFVITVLLARWLSLEAFGAYTVGLTVYLLAGTIHHGVVVEPLLVFGSGRFRHVRREYFGFLVRLHWISTTAIAVLILAAGGFALVLGHSLVGLALIGAACAVPAGLFYWFARRLPYISHDPWPSANAGISYAVLLIVSIWGLKAVDWLSPATALMVIGVCGLTVGTGLFFNQCRRLAPSAQTSELFLRQQWNYSRWSVSTGILGFIPSQALLVVAPLILGLEAAGLLKASLTLVSPIMQATAALSVLLLPHFVSQIGRSTLPGHVRSAAMLLMGAAGLCSVGLYAFRDELIRTLFGTEMLPAVEPLLYLAWIPILSTAVNVFAASLRAAESPRRVFDSYAIAAVVTLLAGIPLLLAWGVVGGALAMLLAYLINAISMWLFAKYNSAAQLNNQLAARL